MNDALTTHVDIRFEVCERLGIDRKEIYYGMSHRSLRIFRHYQRTWDRAPQGRRTHLYLSNLVDACISNLAGSNGVDNSRTEVRL